MGGQQKFAERIKRPKICVEDRLCCSGDTNLTFCPKKSSQQGHWEELVDDDDKELLEEHGKRSHEEKRKT